MVNKTNLRKIPYRLGDLFEVPLTKIKSVIGLIAIADFDGLILGYFFDFKEDLMKNQNNFDLLRYDKSIMAAKFLDSGLLNGEWPIIGHFDNWKPEEWPMPLFVHIDSISGKARLRKYNNKFNVESETNIEIKEVTNYPSDFISGHKALEFYLAGVLGLNLDVLSDSTGYTDSRPTSESCHYNINLFNNDDALDMISDLLENTDSKLVWKSIKQASIKVKYIDVRVAANAIMASEVVAAVNGKPSKNLPDDLKKWIDCKYIKKENKLTKAAIMATETVLMKSELRDLMEDSQCFLEWSNQIKDLLHRLSNN